MEPTKETEEDTEANRVIEYYKKYAQNPDLLKYFTGTEASFVGKKISNFDLRKDVPSEIPKLVISENAQEQGEDQNSLKESVCGSPRNMQSQISPDIEIKISEQEEIEEKNPSRSSSVASNKIEWDNGADIGYKNSYQFLSTRKSASFPSLLTNSTTINSKVLPKDTPEKSVSENIQELRKMYTQLTFSSETSNSTNKGDNLASPSKVQSTGSSSSQESKNMKMSSKSSSGSDSYLRKKIGYPVAYSTPHEGSSSKESTSKSSEAAQISTKPEGYTVTPMLTLPMKPKRNLIDDKQFINTENREKVGNRKSSPEQLDILKVIEEKAEENPKKFQKRINLCLTKPISVECVSLESKKSVHKDVQTSFSSNKSSKCVQTEDVKFENLVSDQLIRCTPQTQNIEYINFTDNSIQSPVPQQILERFLDESSNSKKIPDLGRSNDEKNCKATQTDYVCSSKTVKSRRITCNNKESKNNKKVDVAEPKKISKKKICYDSTDASSVDTSSDGKKSTSVSVESTESSEKNPVTSREYQTEEMLLAQMISLNYSNDLNTDIKRSIDVLQKLLKSKKYDQATKKYYIKKIVQKIVDSKYSDDSTSSDLFRPKKNSSGPKIPKETRAQTQMPKTTPKLMDNLPWYPVSEPMRTMPKNENKKTEVKTVIEDNTKPTKDINNFLNTNVKRNQTFVLSKQKAPIKISEKKENSTEVPLINSEDVYPSNYSSKEIEMKQKLAEPVKKVDRNPKLVSNSTSKLIRNPVHENDNRPTSSEGKIGSTNWRTAKTLSEKLLENRDIIDFKKGQGDYLLHVVKNERHHQLSWINNEIEHLVKLKELLEKKPDSARPDSKLNDVISSLLKMKVNDMKVQSRSPLQEVHNSGNRKSDRSECSSRDLQTQDEVPSMSSNSPPNPVPAYSDNRQNIQVYTCTTQSQASANGFTEQKKCSCSLETCKCSQTATHEEKDVQCPASRQCTCQTEPKEDANIQCNCKEHAGVSCNCEEIYKETANFCQCKKSSSSSSSSSGSDSFMSCICCKKEKILKNLINKIPLCEPCQEVNQKNFYPHNYCDPSHSCICYNLVNRDILCQFKQTLTELERLDIYQQYCEVLKNCKCCKKCGCKCKLPKKFKNGCAYFLKLEDACPNTHCEEEGSNSDIFCCEEEEDEEEEDRENYLPEVTVKVPNCKGPCARKKKNEKRHETKKYTSCPSIQSYLCTMKPEFVARAEHRRRILKDATSQREENSENRKLNFIEKINYLNQKKRNDKVSSESNIYRPYGYQAKTYCVFDIELNDSPKKVQPRVFKSFKEMKDLTRRRYLHLTEVKSKKNVHREKRLREANRLLANTFTRRLQRSTLRGNVDIPLNVKVVSF